MGLLDLPGLTVLLSRLAEEPSRLAAAAGVRKATGRKTASALVFDESIPATATRLAVIAHHGMTLNGKDDERLRHKARSLARSGTRCALPHLPGLSMFRLDPGDPAAIAELVRLVSEERGQPVGERHRLVVTRLLQNVTPSGILDLRAAVGLLRALLPLVRVE